MAKQEGGEFYGEGMKGYVEDAACLKDDPKTFCAFLNLHKEDISKITLYNTSFDTMVLSKKDEISNIIDLIRTATKIVAKTFKGDNPSQYFKNELKASKLIADTLPDPKYHTIAPAFVYKKMPVYGFVIAYSSSKPTSYHIFSEGCSTQILDVRFDQKLYEKFIKDIKEGFDAIHEAGICHNDVKPDNMIFCPKSDKFKIIDWELATKFPKSPVSFRSGGLGPTMYNHPLKFYLGGLPAVAARRLTYYSMLLNKHCWVRNLKSYQNIKIFIQTSFDYILQVHASKNKQQLHRMFSPHYDNFGFALTIMFIAEKHKLQVPQDVLEGLLGPFIPKPVLGSHPSPSPK
jgi:serine/threonine protein kinase